MASPGIGAKSYLQWGREVTWATVAVATKRIGILSQNFEQVVTQVPDATLTGSIIQRGIINVAEKCVGTVEAYMTYNELMMFWDGVMGTATYGSNGGVDTGANPFSHTWATEKEFYNSFTLELIEGNIPSTKCQRVLGAKVKMITVSGDAGGIVKVKIDFVGQKMQTNQTPTGALSAAAPILTLTSHGVSMTDGSATDAAADIVIKHFEYTIEAGLDDSRFDCSSYYILEPIRNGVSKATIKVNKEFRTKSAMDDYIAGTLRTPILNLVRDSNYELDFKIDSAVVKKAKSDVNGFGILFEEVELESIENVSGGSHGCVAVIKNIQATITT
jgi:hypothetical protein